MNKTRRQQIAEALDRLALVDEIQTDLETARDEEQDYYDNMPESFQNGEKGEKAQEAIEALEELVNALEEVKSAAESVSDAIA